MDIARPGISKDIIEKAALATAKETPNLKNDQVGELAESIAINYCFGDDGYKLAKKLECDCWDVDSMFVEAMDFMDTEVRELHRAECWKWVKEKKVNPDLPIGTKLTTGVIDGVSEYVPAAYSVKPIGHDDARQGYRRLIIKFEDAKLAD